MITSIKNDGEWFPILKFIDDAGYHVRPGGTPHVIRDSDGSLRVVCWDGEIKVCYVGQYLLIEERNTKGELEDGAMTRSFNVSKEPPE